MGSEERVSERRWSPNERNETRDIYSERLCLVLSCFSFFTLFTFCFCFHFRFRFLNPKYTLFFFFFLSKIFIFSKNGNMVIIIEESWPSIRDNVRHLIFLILSYVLHNLSSFN